MRRLFRLVSLGTLGLSFHCGASGDAEESAAAHTAHDPVLTNSPYLWAKTDLATFEKSAQRGPFATGAALSDDEPLVRRLQAWVDRVHDEVAKDLKAASGEDLAAPRPIVRVLTSKTPNAWVSGIPVCLAVNADLSAIGPERPARTAPSAFVEFGRVREAISMFGGPPQACVEPENWPNKDGLVPFFNALGPTCKLEKTADGVKVTGDGCMVTGDSRGPTRASRLMYYAPSPYVQVTTAMIAMSGDERSIAGVLMHELGHYYRAHVVGEVVSHAYNLWYERKNPEPPVKPSPVEDAADLEARFERVMPFPMVRIDGQRYSYRLSAFVIDGIATLLNDATARGDACDAAAQKLGSWTREFGFGAFSVKPATREAYLAYEEALSVCAPTLRIDAQDGPGTLGIQNVQDAIGQVQGDLKTSVHVAPGGTLADLLEQLQAIASPLDADAADFLAMLRSRHIGKYTVEQEADEFSLEQYSRVGLDPETRVSSYLDLVKQRAAADPDFFVAANGGLDIHACETLYRAGWRTPSGEPAYVPLGNLHEPHHGDCYRLFNMSQEIGSHGWVATGTPPSSDEPWEPLRQRAQEASDAFVTPAVPGGDFLPEPGTPQGAPIVD